MLVDLRVSSFSCGSSTETFCKSGSAVAGATRCAGFVCTLAAYVVGAAVVKLLSSALKLRAGLWGC
jgi:hypothetical protein